MAFLMAATLEPVGYDVRIDVEIRNPETGAIDIDAAGSLAVDAGANATVSEAPLVVAGKTQLVVRFGTPGSHRLRASFEDGRSGSAEVFAYATQLPVWEVSVDDAELASIVSHPGEDRRADMKLTADKVEYLGTLRLHGGSSRYYPKSSFRVDLAPGFALPDGTDNLILRAEWNDKTLLRNFLSAELFRNATWIPTFHVEYVHLRVNQRYYGLMLHVERVDKDFLRRIGSSATGSLYEADPPLEISVPGGNLTRLASRDLYSAVYQQHAGVVPYEDLIDLIEHTLTLPAGEFRRTIEGKVAIDDVLAYLATMAVIQNHDHIRKNYYLYRDPAGDSRWKLFPWDLDLTFGHLFTETGDTQDEQIFTSESVFFGVRVPEHEFYNQLISRVLEVPDYRVEFGAFVRRIARDALNLEFVGGIIDNVLCRATPDILADTKKRSTNDEYLSRVEEIRAFVRARKTYIESLP